MQEIKVKRFGSADHIEEQDELPYRRDESDSIQSDINKISYFKTLCLRKLERFSEAGKIYIKTQRFYRYIENMNVVQSLFGLLLLPMSEDRRLICNEVEILHDNMTKMQTAMTEVERPLYGTYYNTEYKQFNLKFIREIAQELKTRKFFCRFTLEDLEESIPHMKVR